MDRRRALVYNLSKRSVRKRYFPFSLNPSLFQNVWQRLKAVSRGTLALYDGVSDSWANEKVVKPSHDVYHKSTLCARTGEGGTI